MKTYYTASISEVLSPSFKKLSKKFANKLSFLRAVWPDIAPDWALEAWPYSLTNDTVIFKAKKNPMILQFREKELLKLIHIILGESITKVKIFAQ